MSRITYVYCARSTYPMINIGFARYLIPIVFDILGCRVPRQARARLKQTDGINQDGGSTE